MEGRSVARMGRMVRGITTVRLVGNCQGLQALEYANNSWNLLRVEYKTSREEERVSQGARTLQITNARAGSEHL